MRAALKTKAGAFAAAPLPFQLTIETDERTLLGAKPTVSVRRRNRNRNRPHPAIDYRVPAEVMEAFFERAKPAENKAAAKPACEGKMVA